MKTRQIRKGTFQTNSSSAHVIVVTSGEKTKGWTNAFAKGQWNGPRTALEVQFGDYGWEEDCYHGWEDKASYAATWAFAYGEVEHRQMLDEVLKENIPGLAEVRYANPHDPYTSGGEFYATDTKSVIERFMSGSIDHQSVSAAAKVFEAGKEELALFIFNTESALYTGNDNGPLPEPVVPDGARIYE